MNAYDRIPQELRALPQWVAARADKAPVNPRTGQLASVSDASTWATFDEACKFAAAQGLSIGFVLSESDPYCIVDLDDKPDKPASDADRKVHARILEQFNTYTERSRSGRGYHVVLRGSLTHGMKRGNVEAYSSARHMIFTGDVVRDAPIVDCAGPLAMLVEQMRPLKPVAEPAGYVDDSTVADLRSALTAIPADDYELWIRVGHCLQELGARGRSLWLEWSQTSDKWKPCDARRWRTFQCDRAGYQGVFAEAQKRGWVNPRRKLAVEGQDGEHEDLPPIKGPQVTPSMYYGLTGEIMRAASDGTEVHPAATGLAFLAFASAALGRTRQAYVGNGTHHARIYSIHVGRSGVGGKGMALELVNRIRAEAERLRNPLAGQWACGNYHDGGLSSREGLAWLIRDKSDMVDKDGLPIDGGVADKRLFVVEDELVNLLKQSAREGNTLSAALRTAWDGKDLAPATKTNRTRASNPHISIHACITPTELLASLKSNELTNGFANRFLFCFAERLGVVVFPKRTPEETVTQFARALLAAIEHAKLPGEISATGDAKAIYAKFYLEHKRGLGMPAKLRGLVERYPPYAWRLALTFALLDCSDQITAAHMTAALAWLDYCCDSTRVVFSTPKEEADAAKVGSLGEQIVELLRHARGQTMAREALREALKKPSAKELDAAVQRLCDAQMVEVLETPREGGGWPERKYRLNPLPPPPPTSKGSAT